MTDAKTDAKTLTLTIWDDEEQTFTIEQASQMPLPDFGRIWSVRALTLSCKSTCVAT